MCVIARFIIVERHLRVS